MEKKTTVWIKKLLRNTIRFGFSRVVKRKTRIKAKYKTCSNYNEKNI